MRDDFSAKVKDTLAKRVCFRCSNPHCSKMTSGPQADSSGSVSIGVAAHIKAASPGGKRYDPHMSSEERSSIENGIWLCQSCAKLIDSDEIEFSVPNLVVWKNESEDRAKIELSILESNVRINSNKLLVRYYISKSPSVSARIVSGVLADIPSRSPMLIFNNVSDFWSTLYSRKFHRLEWPQRQHSYASIDEYKRVFNDAVSKSELKNENYFFETYRIPSIKECRDFMAANCPVHLQMIDDGMPISEVIYLYTYRNFCAGNGEYIEGCVIRSMWPIFLSIENVSEEIVHVAKIKANLSNASSLNCRKPDFVPSESNLVWKTLPGTGIKPGESIIIPVATLLEPFFTPGIVEKKTFNVPSVAERVTTIQSGSLSAPLSSYQLLGPSFYPLLVEVTEVCKSEFYSVHHFDPENLFFLSHTWMCGSCPYMFSIDEKTGIPQFIREVLVEGKGKIVNESYEIPHGASEIIIAELKEETTTVKALFIDENMVLGRKVLRKGEVMRIPVKPGQRIIRLVGTYHCPYDSNNQFNPEDSWKIVHEFTKEFSNMQFERNAKAGHESC